MLGEEEVLFGTSERACKSDTYMQSVFTQQLFQLTNRNLDDNHMTYIELLWTFLIGSFGHNVL